jgi:hypothetical protein
MGNPLLIELHYLPCIEFMHSILASDAVIFEAYEHLLKQTYRNRCRIIAANGVQDLIIPLKKKSAKIPAKDIEIMYTEKWQHTHLMAVHSAYKSSPYYDYFEADMKRLFFAQPKYLFDYNILWLEWITKTLKTSLNHSFTQQYNAEAENRVLDVRNTISPKVATHFTHPNYMQVFEDKHGFVPNLSIIDWIFNDLTGARSYYAS